MDTHFETPWSLRFDRALEHCRAERWEAGLEILVEVWESVRRSELPGLFYAYFGYGIARCHGKVEPGLRLCLRAVQMEFYQTESYLNLARCQLLAHNKAAACDAIARGLMIDPEHPDLLALRSSLGVRKEPVLPFLERNNPLNRTLGRLRNVLGRKI